MTGDATTNSNGDTTRHRFPSCVVIEAGAEGEAGCVGSVLGEIATCDATDLSLQLRGSQPVPEHQDPTLLVDDGHDGDRCSLPGLLFPSRRQRSFSRIPEAAPISTALSKQGGGGLSLGCVGDERRNHCLGVAVFR